MLPSLCRCDRFLLLSRLRLRCLSLSSSPSAAGGAAESRSPHFMVGFLVNNCGFSAAEAAKVSESIAHLRSTEKPFAVLHFMRDNGFGGSQLRTIVSAVPKFLCTDVESNLAPKFRLLRDMGLSESDLVKAIVCQPHIIGLNLERSFLPRLKMWEDLFGSREMLLRHMKKKSWFLTYDSANRLNQNLQFLRDECGIPRERIHAVVSQNPNIIAQKPDSLRALIARVEKLGIPRESSKLLWTANIVSGISKERVEAKLKLMRSIGWSDSEFFSAVQKNPGFLCLTPELLLKKVGFLIKEGGCTSSYLARHPVLLGYSLKRMIPRLRAMDMLKAKGLFTAQLEPVTFFTLTNEKFMKMFVLQYIGEVPQLQNLLR